MILKFIADENVPFQVVETLRKAGYEVATTSEAAHPGIRNDELAKLSIQLGMTIITRDADFTRLRQSLMRKIKVIYIRLTGDPSNMAQNILDNIEGCINILQDHNVVMLDQEGFHTL